jgi:hypothetical protein
MKRPLYKYKNCTSTLVEASVAGGRGGVDEKRNIVRASSPLSHSFIHPTVDGIHLPNKTKVVWIKHGFTDLMDA